MRESAPRQPASTRGAAYVLPEPFSYRLKRKLLGPPLITERLSEERLGKVVALGVLAPDCISSTAYGSEEMLNILVPYFGLAAFSLLLPITFAILMVLFFVTLSYREVVMVYTKAGGSYVVARDNFGPRIAQIAAVALIIDYILTVAVQTVAGTDALTSAFPSLTGAIVPITVGVVLVLTYGNLRGIREAGKSFALPTYLFIASIGFLVVIGVARALLGQLHAHPIPHIVPASQGPVTIGPHGSASLLVFASVFIMMRAFANGGSSLTGLEAISNGVANFREPTGRNARRVLVLMSCTLGTLVLGVSYLAHVTHAVPYKLGSPTVLSQEAGYVFGHALAGRVGYYAVQATTMLILYTGGNTSFNGFPNLTSFVAQDAFLPRQLTRRGHRLVFSNGIIILAVLSTALIIATDANLSALVSLYAIGVFTGFTMAGSGMVKHHLTHRDPGWRRKIGINGFAAVLSAIVVVIFAVTKFTEGAWLVVVLFPILVFVLIRLHGQYQEEAAELATNAPRAAAMPVLRRHVVIVLVERLDLATARALQYARTLQPDDLRAVHFVLDTRVSQELETQWSQLGLTRFPLDVVECPDRRLERAAMELVAEAAEDGQTEVTVVLPRRGFESYWQRILHDRTADHIATLVSEIPNANATIIPFPLGKRRRAVVPWAAGGAGVAAMRAESGQEGSQEGSKEGSGRRRRRLAAAGSGRRRGRAADDPTGPRRGPPDDPTGSRGRAAADPTGSRGRAADDPTGSRSGLPDDAAGSRGRAAADDPTGPRGGLPADPTGSRGRAADDPTASGGLPDDPTGLPRGLPDDAASPGRAPEAGSGRRGRLPVPPHPWGTGAGGVGSGRRADRRAEAKREGHPVDRDRDLLRQAPGTMPITSLQPRQRARVTGRVRSVRVQAGAGVPSIECTIADETGQLMLIFQGRRRVPGIEPGARITVEGMVGERGRRTVMINPLLTILRTAEGTT